jgi:hypothetical protein
VRNQNNNSFVTKTNEKPEGFGAKSRRSYVTMIRKLGVTDNFLIAMRNYFSY